MVSNIGFQANIHYQISHELRTPLTGILGMAHFLEKTPLNQQQREYLQDIITSAKSLLSLEDKLVLIFKENRNNTL